VKQHTATFVSFIALALAGCVASSNPDGPRVSREALSLNHLRPVATYSIVARDSATGQLGVAVQSHWFSVGAVVPWAEAGVGAVATQSFIEPSYGPLGLELMRLGRSAPEALRALTSTDAGEDVRQVAMVDAQGRVAAHTGSRAIAAKGHQLGDQYSVQANLMDRESVWPAMAKAYESSPGDLAERLLAALEAAEGEGGDIRGRQSAALLVVSAESTGQPWNDRIFDLRIEDHADPLGELRRLVRLQRTYHKLNEGDEHFTDGNMDKAMRAYRAATDLAPDRATNGEAAFWVGVALAEIGRVEEAIPYLARAQRQDARWARLLPRLPASGLLPDDPKLIRRLVEQMQGE
jgi:uncharacterized Ntn-hydrolase superfamily protein